MVGGFSESGLLQKMIADVLSSNIHIITPPDPGLAILKGATIFGHDPFVMKERRSRFTYGVRMSIDFVTGSHPETKKITNIDGKEFCADRFDVHVTAGQKVALGSSNVVKTYVPICRTHSNIAFEFYASTDTNPSYITDPNCRKIGQLIVDVASSGDDRSVIVKMIFGDTELRVEAVETATQKPSRCTLNFLG
ncbi:hypothetical protein DPMN_108650 [Dreissena polymorpha]|uniref:Heat shock protein 70 n=1 Tax=Dreissena polymorpha TaxID=45954 RepID=A0A9D4K997_DREPO|nr:hypothetical protein DPMN_108650 [Dreissena polymorpha]